MGLSLSGLNVRKRRSEMDEIEELEKEVGNRVGNNMEVLKRVYEDLLAPDGKH